MTDYDLRFFDEDEIDDNYTYGAGFYGPDLPDGTDPEANNLDGFPFYVKHLNFDESQAYGATGTGLFAPFLNINGGETILGFNTDEKVSGQNGTDISDPNTNALQFYEIPIIYLDLDHDGSLEAYYQINLDINENNRLDVSLEELQFYVSSPGDGVNGTGYATLDDWNEGGTYAFGGDFELVFDLDDLDGNGVADDGTGNTLILSDQGAGQGKQDYIFYFPVEMFGDVAPDDYLTLYSQFGPDPADDGGFAEWNTLKATQIDGIKFNDRDADGDYEPDAGEAPLEGFTIYIDVNENGVLDDFEPWTQTDVDGQFSFFSLLPDDQYVIREVLDEGDMSAAFVAANGGDASVFTPDGTWIQTTDPLDDGNQIVTVTDPGTYFVAVGNYRLFDISGMKYLDANADGSTNGDVGLAGVTIYIDMDDSGTFNAGDISTVTGVDGSWSITGLDESYIGKTVYEDLTDGWYATVGGSGYGLTGVDRTDLDFANYQKGKISGTKYEDDDGDASTTGDQSVWSGVTIKLLDGDGVFI
ncbi:hypothetical protein, partial [Croceicoccus gelatinilyticus]|uniref:hypothetical protein n=1 Tax=Croceicoccus gelatinilyticus TaxID=2835536 RepID=UPI001BCFA3A7